MIRPGETFYRVVDHAARPAPASGAGEDGETR